MKVILNQMTLFLMLSLIGSNIFGQDPQIRLTASAPNVVEMGEYFRLSYTLNAKGDEFNGPRLDNFLFSGPMLSTNMSTQIINGKVSQSSSYTYNYTVQAQKEGTFTIPSASVKVDGKKYSSNTLKIEVVKASAKSQQTNRSGGTQAAQPGQQEIKDSDLFVRVLVDRNNVYKGEQILATIKVYTRVSLARFGEIKIPAFSGFWSQEIKVPDQISLVRENFNGTIYNVGIIKKSILVPQQTGEIIIEPFELECFINQRSQSRSIFDDFFGSSQTIKKDLVSPEVKVQVKALPSNAPEGFTGAVGSFSMTANLDQSTLKANEAVNLKVRINGKGNFKLIDPVDIEFPADFETYDPKISDNISVAENGITGSRTMDYLNIPRFAGDFKIAPVKFVYFDPAKGEYLTLKSQEFNIHVEKGDQDQTGTVISGPNREDVRYLGADIRFINTANIKLVKAKSSILSKPAFFLLYALIVIFSIAAFLSLSRWEKKRSDLAGLRKRKAGRQSQTRLKAAGKSLKENDKEKFLNDVLKAVWGYLGDKLNLDQTNLNRDFIEMFLASKNVAPELTASLIELLDNCEYLRYAPGDNTGELDSLYKDAHSVINNLEQELRKKKK